MEPDVQIPSTSSTPMETDDIVPPTSAIPFAVPHTPHNAKAQRQSMYRKRKAAERTPAEAADFAKAAAERQRRCKQRRLANSALDTGTLESATVSAPVVVERTVTAQTSAQRQRAYRQRRAAQIVSQISTPPTHTAVQPEQSTWNIKWSSSIKRFKTTFLDNEFGHACSVCDRLWSRCHVKLSPVYRLYRCPPESCLQVDDMIEIEEPRIKDDIFETEEFNEVKREKILPSEELVQEKVNFETVYCTPGIVKVERPDNVESPDSCNAADDNLVPDFMQTVIKTEPREEEEYEEEDVMNTAVEPRAIPPLLWRCPLVSCTEMLNNELELYQHLNLNHTVKGVALLPKSKKAPEPVATGGLSIHPPVIPSPEAICSSDKLFLESAMSSPSVPTTTMVMTNQSVPCSSSAPVTTTTTFSYSSLTTSSPLLVTTVSSLTSTTMCSSVPQCAQVTASSTSPLLCPSTVLPSSDSNTMPSSVSNTMPDFSGSPDICDTTDPLSLETDPLAPDTAPQGLTKLIVVPITSQSTGSKQFLLMTPHDPKSIQNSSTKSSQPLQVYQTPEISTDDLLPCATDESEMFSISLAQFPENRRIPIKHKLLEVVDCIKKKNIGPEKLLIAYHENNDSRSV